MSLYWRKFKSNQNIDLPEKIMRPFWHPVAVKLDDKIFSTVLSHDRPVFVPLVILLIGFFLFYLSINNALIFVNALNYPVTWNKDSVYPIATFSGLFIIACLMTVVFFKMINLRKIDFDRQQRTVHSSRTSLLPHYLDYDYDELVGAIECFKNPFGKRKSWLVLKHQTNNHKIRLCYTCASPQILIGYWSFIVQFMKKDSPLPDVPELHQYPDKIEGVMPNSLVV